MADNAYPSAPGGPTTPGIQSFSNPFSGAGMSRVNYGGDQAAGGAGMMAPTGISPWGAQNVPSFADFMRQRQAEGAPPVGPMGGQPPRSSAEMVPVAPPPPPAPTQQFSIPPLDQLMAQINGGMFLGSPGQSFGVPSYAGYMPTTNIQQAPLGGGMDLGGAGLGALYYGRDTSGGEYR